MKEARSGGRRTGCGRFGRLLLGLMVAVGLAVAVGPAGAQDEAARWVLLDEAGGPGARWDHTLAADEAAGRLVLFGGRDGAGAPLGDTWLFDLEAEAWEAVDGPGPAPRFGHAVAVDPGARAMYLFGGQADGATFFDDAWRLDLETLAWAEIETGAGPRPAARYGTSAVLDGTGRLLVSHGFTFEGRFDDTWALEAETGRWTDISPAVETRPLKRCLHEAVWDEAGGRMLLFGGCSSGFGPCPQGDLWAFDPVERVWTELAATGPAARSNPALVVEPGGDAALMVGGLTEAGYATDLWTLPLGDGIEAGWSEAAASGEGPAPRASHDAVAADGRVYLYGGIGDGGALADMWMLGPGSGRA